MRRLDQVTGDSAVRERRFVLQAIDPKLGYPILEARFSLEVIGPLAAILGENDGDVPAGAEWRLDEGDLDRLSSLIGFVFPHEHGEVRLVEWSALRNVPYLVHTGFELPLMLDGRKPFAAFSDTYPNASFELRMALFDPSIEAGRFIRRIVDKPFQSPKHDEAGASYLGTRSVYVALPGEAWRIDAWTDMWVESVRSGWSEVLERRMGQLLGYTEPQRDWWETRRFSVLSPRR